MSSQPYHVMAKPVGPACNLRCAYCYYLHKDALFPNGVRRMPDEVLVAFTEQYLAQQAPAVGFVWQGGEPTLAGIGFYRRAFELQERLRPPGTSVSNALQTNGVLIDREWAQFLAERGFLVGISIDGPQELHDAYRRDASGSGSWGRAVAGLRELQRAGAEVNALVVVNRLNAKEPRRVYRALRDAGIAHMQLIPCVEPVGDGRASERSVQPVDWGRFLLGVLEEWLSRDVGRAFVQLFEVMLAMRQGAPSTLCVHARTCGRALVLEHNGDLFSCDHFVSPQHRLGNITQASLAEMVDSAQQRVFGEAKHATLPHQCRECEALPWCRGECPRNRISTTDDGEPGLNYLCTGYRLFFREAGPVLQAMADRLAQGVPPAEAARVGAETLSPPQVRGAGSPRPGRNDPCPCGSGRKYKRCCGA
jgi:uncharacterized protein